MNRFVIVLVSFVFAANSARAAEMQYPLAVAVGKDGEIFVADKDMHGVWKIANGKLEALFQGSNKFRTPLNAVRCVAVDAKGRLLAGDSATREVYRFNSENQPEPLTKGYVGIPMAIAFDEKGDILVGDLEIHQLVKVPEAGGEPVRVADFAAPRGLAVDPQGRIWVVDAGGKDQVMRVLPDGKVETVVSGRPMQFPHHIALDKDLNAYICDNYSQAVWKLSNAGKMEKLLEGKPLDRPVGIAFTGERLLVADPHAKKIFELTLDGKATPLAFESSSKEAPAK